MSRVTLFNVKSINYICMCLVIFLQVFFFLIACAKVSSSEVQAKSNEKLPSVKSEDAETIELPCDLPALKNAVFAGGKNKNDIKKTWVGAYQSHCEKFEISKLEKYDVCKIFPEVETCIYGGGGNACFSTEGKNAFCKTVTVKRRASAEVFEGKTALQWCRDIAKIGCLTAKKCCAQADKPEESCDDAKIARNSECQSGYEYNPNTHFEFVRAKKEIEILTAMQEKCDADSLPLISQLPLWTGDLTVGTSYELLANEYRSAIDGCAPGLITQSIDVKKATCVAIPKAGDKCEPWGKVGQCDPLMDCNEKNVCVPIKQFNDGEICERSRSGFDCKSGRCILSDKSKESEDVTKYKGTCAKTNSFAAQCPYL